MRFRVMIVWSWQAPIPCYDCLVVAGADNAAEYERAKYWFR